MTSFMNTIRSATDGTCTALILTVSAESVRHGIPDLFVIPVGRAVAHLELVLHAADGGSDHLVGSIDPATGLRTCNSLCDCQL